MPPLESDNAVQFVRMTMRNVGTEDRTGIFMSAIRGTGTIDRMGGSRWRMTPATKLSFDANSFMCDGKMVYTFGEGGQRYATPKSAYEKPFTGATHSLGNRNETGLVRYSKHLLPGETYSAYFKMPRSFLSDPAYPNRAKCACTILLRPQKTKSFTPVFKRAYGF